MRNLARRLARLEARDDADSWVYISVRWAESMEEAKRRHFGPQGPPPGVGITFIVGGFLDGMSASEARARSRNRVLPEFDGPILPPRTSIIRIVGGLPEHFEPEDEPRRWGRKREISSPRHRLD